MAGLIYGQNFELFHAMHSMASAIYFFFINDENYSMTINWFYNPSLRPCNIVGNFHFAN